MDRIIEEQGIIERTIQELQHLYYHTSRSNTISLTEIDNVIQHIINDMYSLIGYGTAAEPSLSGESIAFTYAINKPKEINNDQRVIFDIGSHEGEYIKVCYDIAKEMNYIFDVHCFEPEPNSFAKLLESGLHIAPGFTLNNIAISNQNGEETLYAHIDGAANASLNKPDYSYKNVKFDIEQRVITKTLKSYCAEHNTDIIDLLKIDAEGSEFEIIEDSIEFIKQRKIRFIQFEFGINYVDLGIFFKDFYLMLSPYYDFYRIHPMGLIPIMEYREEYEVFSVVNYLCELKKDNINQNEINIIDYMEEKVDILKKDYFFPNILLHPIFKKFNFNNFKVIYNDYKQHPLEQLRYIKNNNKSIDIIYFDKGITNINEQIHLSKKYGFCHHFFTMDKPEELNLEDKSYKICKIDYFAGNDVYLITNNWGYIEFGKKFGLEFIK